jgi:hypothetical protein
MAKLPSSTIGRGFLLMAEDSEFQRLSQLLPFYVNGTLGADECAHIDAALALSPALREELALLGRLAQGVKTGGRDLTQGTTGKLAARLPQLMTQDTSAPSPTKTTDLRDGLAGLLLFLHPQRWHPAVALSLALAIAAQAGVIASLNRENKQGASKIASLEKQVDEVEFQLAAGPGGEEARQGNIMVQLSNDASWSDFSALLADEGLTIVGGPSDATLILSSAAKDAALAAQINRLRASALIATADKAE